MGEYFRDNGTLLKNLSYLSIEVYTYALQQSQKLFLKAFPFYT